MTTRVHDLLSPGLAVAGSDSPLSVRGLTVSHGDGPALFPVDADIAPATMTGVIGPNGAGKSTLLKAALGLIPRLSGAVTIFGQPFARVRDRVAHVPQRASVNSDFPARVRDVVAMGLYSELGLLGRLGPEQRARVAGALARVGMTDFADRQIGALSGGQQQRVFMARALVQGADLYLLDEPFAGVDAATEAAIVGALKTLQAAGRTIVVVHHDLSTVPACFDQVLLLNRQVIAQGPVGTPFTQAHLEQTYDGRLPPYRTRSGAGHVRKARFDLPC